MFACMRHPAGQLSLSLFSRRVNWKNKFVIHHISRAFKKKERRGELIKFLAGHLLKKYKSFIPQSVSFCSTERFTFPVS
jgi:hypothetical protein